MNNVLDEIAAHHVPERPQFSADGRRRCRAGGQTPGCECQAASFFFSDDRRSLIEFTLPSPQYPAVSRCLAFGLGTMRLNDSCIFGFGFGECISCKRLTKRQMCSLTLELS